MNIAIIGAGGKAGNRLVHEATHQDHRVTAIVRDKEKFFAEDIPPYEPDHEIGLAGVIEKDLFDLTGEDIRPFDVVIDAFKPPEGKEAQHVSSIRHLIDLFTPLPDIRLMVVGGAGSLFTEPGSHTRLMETKSFPPAYLPTAVNMAKAFELLVASNVNWTYLSPAAFFDPEGHATGEYILGGNSLILNEDGESYVSYADYAKAMIDEIRNRKFVRKRFTVVSGRS